MMRCLLGAVTKYEDEFDLKQFLDNIVRNKKAMQLNEIGMSREQASDRDAVCRKAPGEERVPEHLADHR